MAKLVINQIVLCPCCSVPLWDIETMVYSDRLVNMVLPVGAPAYRLEHVPMPYHAQMQYGSYLLHHLAECRIAGIGTPRDCRYWPKSRSVARRIVKDSLVEHGNAYNMAKCVLGVYPLRNIVWRVPRKEYNERSR